MRVRVRLRADRARCASIIAARRARLRPPITPRVFSHLAVRVELSEFATPALGKHHGLLAAALGILLLAARIRSLRPRDASVFPERSRGGSSSTSAVCRHTSARWFLLHAWGNIIGHRLCAARRAARGRQSGHVVHRRRVDLRAAVANHRSTGSLSTRVFCVQHRRLGAPLCRAGGSSGGASGGLEEARAARSSTSSYAAPPAPPRFACPSSRAPCAC